MLSTSTETTGPLPLAPKKRRGIWFVLGCVVIALAGIAGGVYAGVPGMVERAGEKALGRLEERFGVRIDAAEVTWTWGGTVAAKGVVVRGDDGEVLATADALDVESQIDFWERHVRVLRVALDRPVLKVTRDAAGRSNLDRLVAALRKAADAKAQALGGGVTIAPELPIVVMDDATLALDAVLPPLPFGLTLPGKASFEGGKVTLRPVAPSPGGVAETPVRLEVAFASTSLDPGQGLTFSADGPLSGPPTRVELAPARPVRFWLGDRVVGIGGAALTVDGFELGPLQLSVPIRKTGAAEVAAAASCDKVILSPSPREVLQRVAVTLTLNDKTAPPGSPGRAADGVGGGIDKSKLMAVLGALDEVKLVKPILSLAIDANGHHDLEDLLPPLRFGPQLGVAPGGAGGPGADLVRAVTDASLTASERLLASPSSRANAKPDAKPLSARVAAAFEALDRISRRRVPELARAFMPLVVKRLSIADGEVMLAVPGANLTFAGLALDATLEGDKRRLHVAFASADAGDPDADKPSLTLDAALEGASLHAEIVARGLPMSLFAHGSMASPPFLAPIGRLGELALTFDGDVQGAAWELGGKASIAGASFFHPALAHDPLSEIDLTMQGVVRWSATEGRLTIADGVLSSRGVTVRASVDVADAQRKPKIHAQLDLPETPVQRIVDAIPKGFAPLLAGLRMEGLLRWPLTIDLDTAVPADVKIDSNPSGRGIAVTTLGDKVDFAELRASHSYSILLADGTPGQRMVGPMTGSWVGLGGITPYLPLALTTTEDGTFYSNDGISTRAMKESIATNLERGGFVRGASTLTQQLVKNLYLGPDKTVSRKLQEVFIAWQMAQNLSKEEVMALYLNTIEFGPGIYGIGDAAWHWFGKRPIDLSLTESIFLASIIPGPRKYYYFFANGGVTPKWQSYLEALLRIMVERGKITEQELLAAAPYQPLFRGAGGGYSDTPPSDFDDLPDKDEPDEAPE